MYSPTPNDRTQKALLMGLIIRATKVPHCAYIPMEFRDTQSKKKQNQILKIALMPTINSENSWTNS